LHSQENWVERFSKSSNQWSALLWQKREDLNAGYVVKSEPWSSGSLRVMKGCRLLFNQGAKLLIR
jgi:hypothetical protein